ncbi:MAG: SDR family NAD(P)-dependent oxidoreductase, partial [Planctomycetota bacterium]
MDLGIKDRVAVVLASSKGLGKGSAMRLAEEGCRMAICARGKEALEATAKEMREKTGVPV